MSLFVLKTSLFSCCWAVQWLGCSTTSWKVLGSIPQDPSPPTRPPWAKRLLNEKIYKEVLFLCWASSHIYQSFTLFLFLSFLLFLFSFALSASRAWSTECSTHVYKWRRNLCSSQVDSLNLQGIWPKDEEWPLKAKPRQWKNKAKLSK